MVPGCGEPSRPEDAGIIAGSSLRATVKLKQVGPGRFRVSVLRGGEVTSKVECGWERASRLAWRAVALLGRWEPRVTASAGPGRFVVVDTSIPSEDPPLPGGFEGQVVACFRSLERARVLAREEIGLGNLGVVVIDRAARTQVFPRPRMDSALHALGRATVKAAAG